MASCSVQPLLSHNATFCLTQPELFILWLLLLHSFAHEIMFYIYFVFSLSFRIHLFLEKDWIVMDQMPDTTVTSWDFIISAPLARPHLNAVALMKVLKYEETLGRHLWAAKLFTHPVHLINAMSSEGLKSFPVLKTPHSSSSSIHGSLFDV